MYKLCTVPFGSVLYGTNTDDSDSDFKCIYMPPLKALLLGKPSSRDGSADVDATFQVKKDKNGNLLGPKAKMPAGGTETEFIPLRQFVYDYFEGQTYALEVVCAVLKPDSKATFMADARIDTKVPVFYAICKTLHTEFPHKNIYKMVGFSRKQTFDYVRRGERLKKAHDVLAFTLETQKVAVSRLLTKEIFETLVEQFKLDVNKTFNGRVPVQLFELNGRQYQEGMALRDFVISLQSTIAGYGRRSNAAATDSVDFRSLYHAIRVYEEAFEYLETGWITLPRPNAEQLTEIKLGKVDPQWAFGLLREYEDKLNGQYPETDESFDEVTQELHARAIERLWPLVQNVLKANEDIT